MLVLGPMGESFGRVRDVVISIGIVRQQPRVLGLVVDLATRRKIFIPILRVATIAPEAVTLATGNVSLRHFEQRPGEVLALGQVLDTPVRSRSTNPELPELTGADVVITDLGIEQARTRDWMVTRIAVRGHRRLGRRGPVHVVDWDAVAGFDAVGVGDARPGVAQLLSSSTGAEPSMWPTPSAGCRPSGASRCSRRLTTNGWPTSCRSCPSSDQAEVLAQLGTERSADVLEEMDPDDAADLLGMLNPTDAEMLLTRMDPDDSDPCDGC